MCLLGFFPHIRNFSLLSISISKFSCVINYLPFCRTTTPKMEALSPTLMVSPCSCLPVPPSLCSRSGSLSSIFFPSKLVPSLPTPSAFVLATAFCPFSCFGVAVDRIWSISLLFSKFPVRSTHLERHRPFSWCFALIFPDFIINLLISRFMLSITVNRLIWGQLPCRWWCPAV